MSAPMRELPRDSPTLARYELRRNPVYDKVPDERRRWYIKESLRIGTDAARVQTAGGKGLRARIEEEGIEVLRRSGRSAAGGTALRSEIEYRPEHTRIVVYEESILLIVRECAGRVPKDLRLGERVALDMHLAHEFFHYLEFSSGQTTSQRLPEVEVPFLGPLRRRVELSECCEIAAQAFAMRVCNLAVLPTYYDLAYMRVRAEARQ